MGSEAIAHEAKGHEAMRARGIIVLVKSTYSLIVAQPIRMQH